MVLDNATVLQNLLKQKVDIEQQLETLRANYILLTQKQVLLSEEKKQKMDKYNEAKIKLTEIYKNKECLVVGCSHGNRDLNHDSWHAVKHHKKAFDKCFIFGKKMPAK